MRARRTLTLALLLGAALVAAAQSVDITFVNRTGATIFFLYASSSDSDTWGNDLLGATVLPDGGVYRARLRSGAPSFDIRAIDGNENEYIIWGWSPRSSPRVILSTEAFAGTRSPGGLAPPPPGRGALSWISIVNDTNYDIEQIFVAPAGARDWDEGEQVLRPGQQVLDGEDLLVELDPRRYRGSLFDIMLIDVDGDSYIKWDVNLELVTEVVFTLEDLVWR